MEEHKMKTKMIYSALLSILFLSCEKEDILTERETPKAIKSYVSTHFSDLEIIQTLKEKDGFEVSYHVILEGGIQLEFNKKEKITSIESTSKLPDSVIPEKILLYVTTNYENNVIVAWEKDDRNQQVTLENSLELEFNMNGDFLKIDN